MPNADSGSKPSKPRCYLKYKWIVRGVSYFERKLEQRRAKYEKENAADRAARRTADATWAIFLLTLVIMVVGYLQWRSMQGQLDEMKSSGTQTDQLIAQAKKSAEAARDAADTATAANRAWISPITARLTEPLDINKPVAAITVTTQNIGKEPALGVVFGALIDIAKPDQIQDREVCNGLLPQKGQVTMFPSASFVNNLNYASEFKNKAPAIADIIAGQQILFVMGCIAYETGGKPRKTGYCFYLYPEIGPETGTVRPKSVNEWAFKSCPVGNYAD